MDRGGQRSRISGQPAQVASLQRRKPFYSMKPKIGRPRQRSLSIFLARLLPLANVLYLPREGGKLALKEDTMLDQNGFDLWADGYERAVGLSDEENSYPFAGYQEILSRIYKIILAKGRPTVLDIGFGTLSERSG